MNQSYSKWDQLDYKDLEAKIDAPSHETKCVKSEHSEEQTILKDTHYEILELKTQLKDIQRMILLKPTSNRRRRKREKFMEFKLFQNKCRTNNWKFSVDNSILVLEKINNIAGFTEDRHKCRVIRQDIQNKENEIQLWKDIFQHRNAAQLLRDKEDFRSSLEQYKLGLVRLTCLKNIVGKEETNSKKLKDKNFAISSKQCCRSHSFFIKTNSDYNAQKNFLSEASEKLSTRMVKRKKTIHIVSGKQCDLNVGAGMVEYKLKRWAQSADYMKKVLMYDQKNGKAWKIRGAAFREMGVPLLEKLHIDASRSCSTKDQSKYEAKYTGINQNEDKLVIDHKQKKRHTSVKDLFVQALKSYQEGNCIFREQFYKTSAEKYENAANLMNLAENILRTPLPSSLNRIRILSSLGYVISSIMRKTLYNDKIEKSYANASKCLKKESSNDVGSLRHLSILCESKIKEMER